MHTLLSGLGLLESPRWHDGHLYFSDWTAGAVHRVDEDGRSEIVARHESLPLCFDFRPDATMLLVSGPRQALLRVGADGELPTYADYSALTPYGANDIVIDGRGNAYVNASTTDFAHPPPDGAPRSGFVFLATPDGTTRVVADDLDFPNGMAVTADNRTLVVAESYRHRLTAFPIEADGSLGPRRVFAQLADDISPDGITLDADGAAWCADVATKRCLRVADGGAVLDTVTLDRGAFACVLGGPDGRTLFVVGAQWPGMAGLAAHVDWDGCVWSTRAPAPRAGWPGN